MKEFDLTPKPTSYWLQFPLGSIRDKLGNALTYRNSDGYSYEYTYDKLGNELTYRNSNGFSYECTRDKLGNVLTYRNSNGFSYECTRDKLGNVLTYRDSDGEHWIIIGKIDDYDLKYHPDIDCFSAGCRQKLTREEALKHWNREDDRAVYFTMLILSVKKEEVMKC
ncbi:MAG: hypothetical protein ACRDBG_06510 [Waterburya sp.]